MTNKICHCWHMWYNQVLGAVWPDLAWHDLSRFGGSRRGRARHG